VRSACQNAAAIDERINAPPKAAAFRPFGWKPGGK
jgi:hypothetical protein